MAFRQRTLATVARATNARAVLAAAAMVLGMGVLTAPSAFAAAGSTATFSCYAVTFNFTGFPDANNNTVTENVRVDGVSQGQRSFTFNGPTGSNSYAVKMSAGHHSIAAIAKWNTNGVKGGATIRLAHGIKCAPITIHVPADRSNLISGDETLVVIALPSAVDPETVRVSLNGSDVTAQFAERANGQFEGLLTGMKPGSDEITATAPGEATAKYALIDHLIGGSVLAGPQVQPWRCKNAHPTDAQCDEPPTYSYQYKSTLTGRLETYNPESPPEAALIENVTAENGTKVPYIVRTETGYQDRDQYSISVLYQPGRPWTAWEPQPQFNHKLLVNHGSNCGLSHENSTAPSTIDETGLPLGFAVMSTALDNAGHNCNVALEAESLIMAKEHLIDHYGTLKFTIAEGCSGGGLAQQQIANAYPGIYQGLTPQCSFQDAWSNGSQIADDHATLRYFEDPAKWGTGVVWTPTQMGEVQGLPDPAGAAVFNAIYWEENVNPVKACAGVESSEAYNPQTNPGGVRCDQADYMINVFGPRPQSEWGPVEEKLGHGFAGRPVGNVGEQYGLRLLTEGKISPAQFVDINAKIGGVGIDAEPTASRTKSAQSTIENAFRSGAIDETNNLKAVAIIDQRGPGLEGVHDAYRSWSMRARLEREEGHFPRNQVIWFGPQPWSGSPNYQKEAILAMNEWLDAVEADHSGKTLEEKISSDRPQTIHDRCTPAEAAEGAVEMVEINGEKVCQSPAYVTKYQTARMIAGESITTDNVECQLKPLERSSYYPVEFTEEEWKELEAAFPTGVCDFSKPGVGQQPTVPWQTYQDDAKGGEVVYGGKALGAAPVDSGEGWTSETFASWLR